MKPKADKSNFLVSSYESFRAKIEDFSIKNTTKEKPLGVKFVSNLSFENHVTSYCKKTSHKLHALSRISYYMNLNKRRILMKAFIISPFSYCPLIWMFDSVNLKNEINKIHERALRLVFQNNLSFFELLNVENSVTVHGKICKSLWQKSVKLKME